MKKRVLFWSERFWPTTGGVGLKASQMLPALRDRGYAFAVVTLKENADLPEEDEFHGIRVYRWPFWAALSGGDVIRFMELRKRVAELKRNFAPDLVHINFLGSTVLFHAQTVDAHPAPVLVSLDSAFLTQGTGEDSLAGKVLRSAAWVTTVSRERLQTVRRTLPELVSRSSCIYMGAKWPAIDRRPIPTDPPRLLCLGRLHRVKGFDLAIEAFESVSRHYPEARLLIAGDGPERQSLTQQIIDLGLDDRVEMLGRVEPVDVPDLLSRATVVVMPSRDEGIPNVAIEAGMAYRPVVATRVGGIPEAIVDGETGLLVDFEDVPALTEAILSLLEDAGKANVLGSNARVRVDNLFGFERWVNAYDRLYQQLTS